MRNNKLYDNFVGKYPLSKTLRFELVPIGKTMDNLANSKLIEKDEHRDKSYSLVKKLIDEYHKQYIEKRLKGTVLSGLEEYARLYANLDKSDKEKELMEECQSKLRKQIVSQLKDDEQYKRLFGKELITEELNDIAKTDEEKLAIEEFSRFTTVFVTGFNENRKNMYKEEPNSTAIAYRLINWNLPKFMDNIAQFEKIEKTEEFIDYICTVQQELAKALEGKELSEVFALDGFNDTLTQTGIQKYNEIIGGYVDASGKKIKGLNEYINEYNQTHKNKIGKLKMMYKQILSDRDTISFIPEEIANDREVIKVISQVYISMGKVIEGDENNVGIISLTDGLANLDLERIYVKNNTSVTELSQGVFSDWSVIPKALNKWYDSFHVKKSGKEEKYDEERKAYLKKIGSYSIGFLQRICKECGYEQSICSYLSERVRAIIDEVSLAYEGCIGLFNGEYEENTSLIQDKSMIEKIKRLLDSMKALQTFMKPIMGCGEEGEKDERFYGELQRMWDEVQPLTLAYNRIRNYLTKKPYSEEKIKLNFDNPTLLDGWDLNKEEANASIILRKDNQYYLGILDSKYRQVFRKTNIPSIGNECIYEKMEYKLLPGSNKMLPKVFFCKSRIEEFAPNEEIVRIYKEGTFKKGSSFNLEDCHKLIDFFKKSIEKHEDWSKFNFEFSDTASYEDISAFYKEVEQQGYKVNFVNIPESYIDSLVEEGKLYLFQIYNKDFSIYSKGTPNLHTMYWKALFEDENLKRPIYKLNGQAEIFFRKASIAIDKRVIHPANEPVKNKNTNNAKLESIFCYDLIKDRRYTLDKFQLHVPITMNFVSQNQEQLNEQVNSLITKADDLHIVGIDRGERHLLYISVINMAGEIVEQYSLNSIINEYDGKDYKTDYHYLLDKREKERTKARESWQTIENIKELKEGYLSQVIYKITQLMMKYNAIVVLEDLNFGFMRGRQKVEKQVYQKFEKMLIDKLNYLVDKKKLSNEFGGLMKAYQLTNKFESFKKLGKQSGVLYYVPAWNTSKLDPSTGFVNLLYPKYESVEKAKIFFQQFEDIRYYKTLNEEYFIFNIDYKKFTYKAQGTKEKWQICSYGERIVNVRSKEANGNWESKKLVLTEEYKRLFEEYGIDYSSDLKERIVQQSDKGFFERLIYLLKVTLQIRNSVVGTDEDYLLSPVKDTDGQFFDSRRCQETMPRNADANGAYNIARKGLMIVEQIRQNEQSGKKLKLDLSNKAWLLFAQR